MAGISLHSLAIQRAEDFKTAFDNAAREHVQGIIILSSPIILGQRELIAGLALGNRQPTISLFTLFPKSGGLIGYGPNLPEMYKRAGNYVDRILKGAKAADLPIERPIKCELVINLQTAKALGISIPSVMLARADEVIE